MRTDWVDAGDWLSKRCPFTQSFFVFPLSDQIHILCDKCWQHSRWFPFSWSLGPPFKPNTDITEERPCFLNGIWCPSPLCLGQGVMVAKEHGIWSWGCSSVGRVIWLACIKSWFASLHLVLVSFIKLVCRALWVYHPMVHHSALLCGLDHADQTKE